MTARMLGEGKGKELRRAGKGMPLFMKGDVDSIPANYFITGILHYMHTKCTPGKVRFSLAPGEQVAVQLHVAGAMYRRLGFVDVTLS